jgi:hypothetical protein
VDKNSMDLTKNKTDGNQLVKTEYRVVFSETRWSPPEKAILIERIPMVALASWFMDTSPLTFRESERPYIYYRRLTGEREDGTSYLYWMSKDKPPTLTKFDYVILKYLLAGHHQIVSNGPKFELKQNIDDDLVRSVFIDLRNLKSALGYSIETGIRLKQRVEESLVKLERLCFSLDKREEKRDCFIEGFGNWSKEAKDGKQSGYEVKMRDSMCFKIACKPGMHISKKRTYYPISQVIGLHTKSKAINFFSILDRILTLPVKCIGENKTLMTRRTENDEFLTRGSGAPTILEDIHRELSKKDSILNMEVRKKGKKVRRSYQYTFEFDKSMIPRYF